jgi:hypothetical protein
MGKESGMGMETKDHFSNTQAMEHGGVDNCKSEFRTSA